VDLPGSYSLSPQTLDEEVVRDELRGARGFPPPDLVVVVMDATNLARNLFLGLQVLETGIPAIVALNCSDQARDAGVRVDARALANLLGVPVVPTVGRTGEGLDLLREAIAAGGAVAAPPPARWAPEVESVAAALAGPLAPRLGGAEAARRRLPEILGSEALFRGLVESLPPDLAERARAERSRLPALGVDAATASAEARYRLVDSIVAECVRSPEDPLTWRERLDRVLTHRVLGSLVLLAVFTGLFEVLFSWSGPLMDGVSAGTGWFGRVVGGIAGEGLLGEFLVNGLVKGFEGVLVFVPQIALLFVLIELMEDSGYLARAAFLLDRLMGKAGLPGRAFLPLVSGVACAIPGVMATRTIKDPRDRYATMFAVPFMSCSARLPVYSLIVGAFFSEGTVLGFLRTGTVVTLAMYALGTAAGLLSAGLLRRTILKGGRSPLLLELPPYRRPQPRVVLLEASRRTWQFVSRAGPVIVVLSMVLWALATFPREVPLDADYGAMRAAAPAVAAAAPEAEREAALAAEIDRIDRLERSERSAKSYAGVLGHAIEPVIRPLGFDWKMGIGIVASFAAREVFVSSLAIVYASGGDEEEQEPIRRAIVADVDPRTGKPVFRPLVGISLLVFFVLAMQCISTLAVVRRETGGWKWPVLMLVWMTLLAYGASLLVFQAGTALGF
jgi:ferrous iron transport protein B